MILPSPPASRTRSAASTAIWSNWLITGAMPGRRDDLLRGLVDLEGAGRRLRVGHLLDAADDVHGHLSPPVVSSVPARGPSRRAVGVDLYRSAAGARLDGSRPLPAAAGFPGPSAPAARPGPSAGRAWPRPAPPPRRRPRTSGRRRGSCVATMPAPVACASSARTWLMRLPLASPRRTCGRRRRRSRSSACRCAASRRTRRWAAPR